MGTLLEQRRRKIISEILTKHVKTWHYAPIIIFASILAVCALNFQDEFADLANGLLLRINPNFALSAHSIKFILLTAALVLGFISAIQSISAITSAIKTHELLSREELEDVQQSIDVLGQHHELLSSISQRLESFSIDRAIAQLKTLEFLVGNEKSLVHSGIARGVNYLHETLRFGLIPAVDNLRLEYRFGLIPPSAEDTAELEQRRLSDGIFRDWHWLKVSMCVSFEIPVFKSAAGILTDRQILQLALRDPIITTKQFFKDHNQFFEQHRLWPYFPFPSEAFYIVHDDDKKLTSDCIALNFRKNLNAFRHIEFFRKLLANPKHSETYLSTLVSYGDRDQPIPIPLHSLYKIAGTDGNHVIDNETMNLLGKKFSRRDMTFFERALKEGDIVNAYIHDFEMLDKADGFLNSRSERLKIQQNWAYMSPAECTFRYCNSPNQIKELSFVKENYEISLGYLGKIEGFYVELLDALCFPTSDAVRFFTFMNLNLPDDEGIINASGRGRNAVWAMSPSRLPLDAFIFPSDTAYIEFRQSRPNGQAIN